jgi:hypothetical protein
VSRPTRPTAFPTPVREAPPGLPTYRRGMTTTPQEPDPDVVPSGDPEPIPTDPQPGMDPQEDPQTQPAPPPE